MFYFLCIFKTIDKLFLVVQLCEQSKLQAFQTIKKLKREPSDNTLPDQRLTKQGLQNKNHNSWLLFKGELQGQYKLLSYKRALNLLNNDICIAEIGQAVLELLRSKVETGDPHRSRKFSFSDFSNSPLVPKMT